jgi:23S rRNA pseudouridine955/2504/2580 synthase
VNKGRIQADYRVQPGDVVRVPPIRVATPKPTDLSDSMAAQHVLPILYEDDAFIAIDKPAGLAVHGGSGVSFGLIELLRRQRPDSRFLELVHRLDKETSGIILVAKKRSALLALHQAMRTPNGMQKEYLAMVQGHPKAQAIKLPLLKYVTESGERRVKVSEDGQFSHTIITPLRSFTGFTLVRATLKTGRTHQIRVHLASQGFPILGDDKYGDFALNKAISGLKRMFLHAHKMQFAHPLTQEKLNIEAPLPQALQLFMDGQHENI